MMNEKKRDTENGNIGSGETLLWLCDPVLFEEPSLLVRCGAVLSREERERANRFHFEKDRRLFIISHAFLRFVLSRYLEHPPGELSFRTNSHGKPFLDVSGKDKGLRFNLSHTRGLVALILGVEEEVGCDVECTERSQRFDDLGKHFFSPSEVGMLEKLSSSEERKECFFRLWTLKEAYIKAVGRGLSLSLKSFSISFSGEGGGYIEFKDDILPEKPSEWEFRLLQPTASHRVALCRQVLNKRVGVLKAYWFNREFKGEKFSPDFLAESR